MNRLIEKAPTAFLHQASLATEDLIFDWPLSQDEGLDLGLPNPPLANRRLDQEAEDIHILELAVLGLGEEHVKLSWRSPGQPFGSGRQITRGGSFKNGSREMLVRFPVYEHPGWSGPIAAIRLQTARTHREKATPLRLRAYRRTVHDDLVNVALSGAWLADLNQDVRPAIVGVPGRDKTWNSAVPREASLHFAYGVQPGFRSPLTFQILASGEGHRQESVFSRTVSPEETGWQDESIDLARYGGQAVELTFRVHCPASCDLATGFPLWSNPEIEPRKCEFPRPDVILVSVDTLRADHCSVYGYQRPTTPGLESWAKRQGIVFSQAVAQAASTLPSHASIFTGLNAFRHGANHQAAPPSLLTLAESLREQGYRTLAQTGGGYLHPRFGLNQGFDVYRYWLDFHDRDRELDAGIQAAREWLNTARESPVFVFLHTYEPHGPYRARQPFFRDLTGEEDPHGLLHLPNAEALPSEGFRLIRRPRYWLQSQSEPGGAGDDVWDSSLAVDLYDSSVAYVDHELSQLLQWLEKRDPPRETVVVITSDHGESFGEQNLAGHGYLYDSNLLVPLLLGLPHSRGAGQVIQHQVRSVDILPTLLEVLDLPAPKDIDGSSLLPLVEDGRVQHPRLAWSYAGNSNHGVSLRQGSDLKYVLNNTIWSGAWGSEEVFALGVDPHEMDNIAGKVDLEATQDLRKEVYNTLVLETSGLQVHLGNASQNVLAGSIQSTQIEKFSVKGTEADCPPLEWQKVGLTRFTIPPGRACTLVLEFGPGSPHRPLEVALEGSSAWPPQKFALDTQALIQGSVVTVKLAHGRWQEETLDAPETLITGVQIWRRGGGDSWSADSPESDADLMLQLQALGYLQ